MGSLYRIIPRYEPEDPVIMVYSDGNQTIIQTRGKETTTVSMFPIWLSFVGENLVIMFKGAIMHISYQSHITSRMVSPMTRAEVSIDRTCYITTLGCGGSVHDGTGNLVKILPPRPSGHMYSATCEISWSKTEATVRSGEGMQTIPFLSEAEKFDCISLYNAVEDREELIIFALLKNGRIFFSLCSISERDVCVTGRMYHSIVGDRAVNMKLTDAYARFTLSTGAEKKVSYSELLMTGELWFS